MGNREIKQLREPRELKNFHIGNGAIKLMASISKKVKMVKIRMGPKKVISDPNQVPLSNNQMVKLGRALKTEPRLKIHQVLKPAQGSKFKVMANWNS